MACSSERFAGALIALSLLLAPACDAKPGSSRHSEVVRPERSSVDAPFVPVRVPEDLALLEAPGHALPGTAAIEAISASFPLRVTRVHVQPGDEVRAGDAIVDVTSQEVLTAAADYVSTSEALVEHEERLANLEHLREERVVAIDRVFEVETKRLALKERQRFALATLRAADVNAQSAAQVLARGVITLRTNTTGIVRELTVVPGQVFPQGGAFATVVGGASPRVEARFVSLLPEGFDYEFEDLQDRKVALGTRPTRVLDAGEEGGFRVWFDLPAGTSLPPGAPGHVRARPKDPRFVQVPLASLVRRGDDARVLRRRGGTETPVDVHVVATSGTVALVVGDLVVGDDVASDGGDLLAPAPAPTPGASE